VKDLKDIAIRFRIDPDRSSGKIVPVKTVVKVLNDLTKSYSNFVGIEFVKKDDFKEVYHRSPEALNSIIADLELNIVDLSFSSFEAAVAPDFSEPAVPIFSDEINDWKIGIYKQYKDDILQGDYTNLNYINSIANIYSEEERKKIYSPLFRSVGDQKSYKLHLLGADKKIIRTIVKPESSVAKFYTSGAPKPKETQELQTVHFFAKVKVQDDDNPLKKQNIKKVLYQEPMEYDTYPFKPKTISCDDTTYILKKELDCTVEYEDGNYAISYDPLDISVWGETRKEAEEAFNFSFHALFVNYAKEANKNLSKKAIQLKKSLQSLIQKTV